jgi:hypothetical protein
MKKKLAVYAAGVGGVLGLNVKFNFTVKSYMPSALATEKLNTSSRTAMGCPFPDNSLIRLANSLTLLIISLTSNVVFDVFSEPASDLRTSISTTQFTSKKANTKARG